MARRHSRRSSRRNTTEQSVDIINGLNVENGKDDNSLAEDNRQNEPSEPAEEERQTRRSSLRNSRLSHEITSVLEDTVLQEPDSQSHNIYEHESESELDEDVEPSVSNLENSELNQSGEFLSPSIIRQEQINGNSPLVVVVNERKNTTEGDPFFSTASRAIRTYTRRSKHVEPENEESQQDDEIAESEQEYVPSENPDMADGLFDSDNEEQTMSRQHRNGVAREVDSTDQTSLGPSPRVRIVDRMNGESQTNESSSRKRRRVPDASETTPDSSRSRRRRTLRSQGTNVSNTRTHVTAPPEIQALEIAQWEASTVDRRINDDEDIVVVAENTIYDEAIKIRNLEGNWKRLMKICRDIKDVDIHRTLRFLRIEEINERISELIQNYKRIQRKHSRGLSVSADTWHRAALEVKSLSTEVDECRFKIIAQANKAKEDNDMIMKAEVTEYAEQIYQQVITNLCELALECLKTYYSEEDEWLLTGGFKEVLDILDIAGKTIVTLTSLQKCDLLKIVRDPARHLRVELRTIYDSLSQCEDYERRRNR